MKKLLENLRHVLTLQADMAASDMGDCTLAETALLHVSIDSIGHLVDSLEERRRESKYTIVHNEAYNEWQVLGPTGLLIGAFDSHSEAVAMAEESNL